MRHRLMVIGSKDENFELVKRANERGYYTIVCDGYKGEDAKKIASESYDVDISDVNSVAKICIEEEADGIIGSFSDYVFQQITKIAAEANLKWYIKPEQLKYYRDKNEQKRLLQKIGITIPKYVLINKDDVQKDIEGISFPCVIKPIDGWGSKDIKVIKEEGQLKEELDSIEQNKTFEVEQYINMPEYNCIAWVDDGKIEILGIADRERNPQKDNNIPCLDRVLYPSMKYDEILEPTRMVLQKFIDGTGQKSGPISMQYFYKDGEIVVCEIAGRILAHEHDLIRYCNGSNLNDLLLDYVYEPEDVMRSDIKKLDKSRHSQGIYFLCEKGTKIEDSSSLKELLKENNVEKELFFCEDGQIYDDRCPYFARCYFKGDSRKELDEIADRLFENARVLDSEDKNVLIKFYREKERYI